MSNFSDPKERYEYRGFDRGWFCSQAGDIFDLPTASPTVSIVPSLSPTISSAPTGSPVQENHERTHELDQRQQREGLDSTCCQCSFELGRVC